MQRWLTFALCLMLAPAWPAGARTLKSASLSPDGTTWMKEMREGAKEIEARVIKLTETLRVKWGKINKRPLELAGALER